MEINFVEDTSHSRQDIFTPSYTTNAIKQRHPVWKAMSELWMQGELTSFDKNYISIRLSDSPFSEQELEYIFEKELAPAIKQAIAIEKLDVLQLDPRILESMILLHIEQSKQKSPALKKVEQLKQATASLFKKLNFSQILGKETGGNNADSTTKAYKDLEEKARKNWQDILLQVQNERQAVLTDSAQNKPVAALQMDPALARKQAEDLV